jgi:uncharacterized protein (TIGR02284 family)
VRERSFRDFLCLLPAKENRVSAGRPTRRSFADGRWSDDVDGKKRISFQERTMNRAKRKNDELEAALRSLIRVLEDSQHGMAEIGERLKDKTLRRYFLMESLRRANFRGELENILHQHGVADVHEGGTAMGAVYRAWGELKAALGAGDDAMLATAEQGEEEARDAYRMALNAELPVPVRQTVVEQRTHILIAHEYLREQREGLKAA